LVWRIPSHITLEYNSNVLPNAKEANAIR